MKLDILTAKLLKKGFAQEKAEAYAVEITKIARRYGVNSYDFIDELSEESDFSELGAFIFNNALRFGYKTGKLAPQEMVHPFLEVVGNKRLCNSVITIQMLWHGQVNQSE